MKIRAKANGNILALPDGEAEALLASGIYEPADDVGKPKQPDKVPTAKAPPTPAVRKESTRVAPMTTQDLPTPPKKLK